MRWNSHTYSRHGDGIASSDTAHRLAMQQSCDALRDRVLEALCQRVAISTATPVPSEKVRATLESKQAAFTAQTRGHEQARAAIRKGIDREEVMALFELSATAYEQLAGQVRAA